MNGICEAGALFLAGNAKARRRWRRRNIPNSQRTDAWERERNAIIDLLNETEPVLLGTNL